MARIYGLTGKMQGKYGNAVFRIRRGTQVMAAYNPVVDNPNTQKQVNARARFKLVSQLASIYASIIAIPRNGAVTSRNLFTKKNFPLSNSLDAKAQINLPSVQLTASNREMPAFSVSRSNGNSILAGLQQPATFSRVVYAVVAKNVNDNLRVFASAVVENTTPNEPNTFAAQLPYTAEAIVVYAYGITDTNAAARAAFGALHAPTAEEVATLVTSRTISTNDVVMTATGGAYMEVGTDDAISTASSGEGSASLVPTRPTIGGYSPFSEYTDVVLSAQPNAEIHYTTNGSTPTAASTLYSEPIRITATTTIKAVAVMNGLTSPVTSRTLTKEAAPVVVQAPVINGTTPFSSTTQVSMSAEAEARIFYTTDGSQPDGTSQVYSAPFTISATTTIKAVAFLQETYSPVTTKVFTLQTGGSDVE